MEDTSPKRKHLTRLKKLSTKLKRVVYFITVCTNNRNAILADQEISKAIVACLRESAEKELWAIGRYVVMPDHIHFFVSPRSEGADLSKFMKRFKSLSSRRLWEVGRAGRIWQKEFFDHLLRSDESYAEKWEYVRHNPVRQGLCDEPEDWEYQGEIDRI